MKFIFFASDNEGLDSIAIEYGDGNRSIFLANRQMSLADSVEHSYLSSGSKAAKCTGYADGKTAEKSITVGVNQNLSPVIDVFFLIGIEGQSSSLPLSSFAHDPEGKTVTVSIKTGNPSVNVSVGSDSIHYSGIDQDVNGSFSVIFSVSDGVNVADKDVPVVIAARDIIQGRAYDAMEGTLPASLKPELVMSKPFDLSKSYLKIDNIWISMDANGNFKSPKLLPDNHVLEVALVNVIGDSSYVATYSLPAGDRTFDPKVNTNAGTGFSLADLKQFYYEANFRANGDNKLHGIDFSHANEHTYWIARKDTVLDEYNHWQEFTVEQQNIVEQYIRNNIFIYLPDSLQPRVYKAALNESLPLMKDQYGSLHATPRTLFITRRDGPNGELMIYDKERDGILESVIITLDKALDYRALGQETFSGPFAQTGVWNDSRFQGKTITFEGGYGTTYLTNIDIKLAYLVINFKPGTSPEDISKLR